MITSKDLKETSIIRCLDILNQKLKVWNLDLLENTYLLIKYLIALLKANNNSQDETFRLFLNLTSIGLLGNTDRIKYRSLEVLDLIV